MANKKMMPISDADLGTTPIISMNEEQATRWFRDLGYSLGDFGGHAWKVSSWTKSGRGFWMPINEVQPLSPREIGRPKLDALAYWAVVDNPDEAQSMIPFIFFDHVKNYDASRLSEEHRRNVRLALNRFEYVQLESPDLLLNQGWDVSSRAAAQSGASLEPDRERFEANLRKRFTADPQLIVAARSGGNLAGYMCAHVIDGTAHVTRIMLNPEFRKQQVGSGLYWATLRHLGKSLNVHRVNVGLSYPDVFGVELFKYAMGATIVDLPVRSWALPPLAWRLRRTNPWAYVRIGGHDQRVRAAAEVEFESKFGPMPRSRMSTSATRT